MLTLCVTCSKSFGVCSASHLCSLHNTVHESCNGYGHRYDTTDPFTSSFTYSPPTDLLRIQTFITLLYKVQTFIQILRKNPLRLIHNPMMICRTAS